MEIFNNQYFEETDKMYVHPAAGQPFETLFVGLMQGVRNKTINMLMHDDGDRVLFNYNQIEVWEQGWNEYNILARGLILSLKEHRIVALPYPKFFNYGEGGFEMPENANSFTAYDKSDGSLGIAYFWKNEWHVATRGSFYSDQARWATQWIRDNWNLNGHDAREAEGATILGEIIYPENKIVIDYGDFEGFVVHGGYWNNSGAELNYAFELSPFVHNVYDGDDKNYLIGQYTYDNIDDIVEVCKNLPVNREGFVLRFNNGYRLKIKGDEYVRVHRLISNVTPLRIWESMLAGDDMEDLKNQLPEEFRETIDGYVSEFTYKFYKIVRDVINTYETVKDFTDKELGLWVSDEYNLNSKIVRDCMFLIRKKDFVNQVHMGESNPNTPCKGSLSRRKVFMEFRPKGNVL